MNNRRREKNFGCLVVGVFVFILSSAMIGPAVLAGAAPGLQATAEMKQDAARVQKELDRIEMINSGRTERSRRSVVFTEKELNAWVAVRLEENREDVLRELVLKLFDDNRIEGKAFVDLSRASLPLGLKPKMNLFFAGRVIVRDGAAKIEFDKLFLEGQVIPVTVLDVLIAAASGLGKSDAGTIKDWMELPYGLKDLQSRRGKVIISY